MMDLYEYMEMCKEEGIPADEALDQYLRERDEYCREMVEELEERQLMTAWQEDLIELRYRER